MIRKYSIKELLLYSGVSNSAYWFANAVLWIPWKFNQWLGIILMILLVPFLWGISSLYCFRKTSFDNIKSAKFVVAIVFLIIAVVSDFFFFAIWRNIPEQLYHPTTFAAYALIIIMPIIVGTIINKRKTKKYTEINNKNLLIIWALGIMFLILTLYSVQFW
jgi:predicted Na+-dependent transporter